MHADHRFLRQIGYKVTTRFIQYTFFRMCDIIILYLKLRMKGIYIEQEIINGVSCMCI